MSTNMRSLLRRPVSAVAIVLTLALGIGANLAGLTVLHAVLLRPLPVVDEDALVVIRETRISEPDSTGVSYPNFLDWAAGARAFEGMSIVTSEQARIGIDGVVRVGDGLVVSQGFFRTLGLRASVGQTLDSFADEALTEAGTRPLMLTQRGWREWFAGDPNIVGRRVLVDGSPGEVVGVTGPNVFPTSEEPVLFWSTPIGFGRRADPGAANGSRNFRQYAGVVARLRAGITPSAAREDIERISRDIAATAPAAMKDRGVRIDGLRDILMADATRPAWLATALVTLIWLVTCVNVANLQLARAASRHRDLTVRRALGASRWQIIRLFLTENLALSLAGGAAGLAVASATLRAATPFIPAGTQIPALALDPTMAGVCLGLSLLTGLACGAGPAWAATRSHTASVSPTDGRQGATTVPRRLRHTLIAAEMAFALILLILGGLFANSLYRLERSTPGFTITDVWSTRVTAPGTRLAEVEARLATQPGVVGVAFAQSVPFSGIENSTGMSLDIPLVPGSPSVQLRFVSPDFFPVLGIPVVDGRAFAVSDTRDSTDVALVSEAFVRTHSPDRPVVGRSVRLGWGGNAPKRIVGVVGDVRHRGPGDAARPEVYVPVAQFQNSTLTALWRVAPGAVVESSTIHRLLRTVDPAMPLLPVRSMASYRAGTLEVPRLGAGLLGGLALLCLVLAGVGLYGVTSHFTALRTHELGVRLALGATPGQVRRLVVRQALAPALVGAVVGLAAASLIAGTVRAWLHDVEPADPLTMVLALGLLLAVAALAAFVPALRASGINPTVALRSQ